MTRPPPALWTLWSCDAAAATGQASGRGWPPAFRSTAAAIEPGDLFIALPARPSTATIMPPRRLPRRRGCAVIARPTMSPAGRGCLPPGRGHLRRPGGPRLGGTPARRTAKVVAVTGSVGKTTTKEALRCAGSGHRPSPRRASYNNQWGRAAQLGPDAASDHLWGVRARHEPRGRDRAAVASGPPDVAIMTTIEAGPSRHLRLGRGHCRRQGRDLRRLSPAAPP